MPSSPLIDRLAAEHAWQPLPDLEAAAAFAAGAGLRVIFIPGDPVKNLESNDVAVILPELVAAFPRAFRVGVYTAAEDRALREVYATWATPSLVLLRDGVHLGSIERVRDWTDYLDKFAAFVRGGEFARPLATAH